MRSECEFGVNVAFNNFSVISRRCLVVTGSSMLTFIVLPHWSIMSQILDMIPHPVTLSWHWVDQSKLYPVNLSAKRGAASTIFNDFGMSRPGIEPVTSRSPERTLYQLSYRGRCWVWGGPAAHLYQVRARDTPRGSLYFHTKFTMLSNDENIDWQCLLVSRGELSKNPYF